MVFVIFKWKYKCKRYLKNLNLPWEWYGVSENQNLTIEFVKKHKDKDWDWEEIAKNSFNGEKEKFEQDKRNYIIQYCFTEHIPIEIRIKIMDLV